MQESDVLQSPGPQPTVPRISHSASPPNRFFLATLNRTLSHGRFCSYPGNQPSLPLFSLTGHNCSPHVVPCALTDEYLVMAVLRSWNQNPAVFFFKGPLFPLLGGQGSQLNSIQWCFLYCFISSDTTASSCAGEDMETLSPILCSSVSTK